MLAIERPNLHSARVVDDLRLLFTTSPLAWPIRLTTGSPIAHVAIATGDTLVHAHGRGVVVEPRAAWLRRHRALGEWRILPNVRHGFTTRVLPRVGTRFDHGGIVAHAIEIVAGVARGRRDGFALPRHPHRLVCSQLVMLLDPAGERIPEWRQLRLATVTPQQLYEACSGPSFRPLVHKA